MGYLRWVLGVALRDKGHRSEICKASMSSHFPEWLDPSYVNSAMRPKCPRKEWRTKSFRLQSTPTGKRPKVCPRARWRDYTSDLAWSLLGMEPAELSDISVDREVFWVLLACTPRDSPERKSGHENEKMNECEGLHWTFLFMKLSLVCLPKVNVVFK